MSIFEIYPHNFIKIETYTPYGKKAKMWDLQPNDNLNLVNYSKEKACGSYHQNWLFQVPEAANPGQTELIFTHKKKKKIFTIHIFPFSIPQAKMKIQYGLFNSHQ